MKRRQFGVVSALALAVLAACGNAPPASSSDSADQSAAQGSGAEGAGVSIDTDEFVPVNAPGVTDSEIRVGGVASVTNPVGGRWGDAFEGVKAYFDMVNSQGGLYGRQLVLADELDDQIANNATEVQRLVSSDVFAVLPVAGPLFTGADQLVRERIPTFGWSIGTEWEGTRRDPRSNLFGQAGSYLCFDCAHPSVAWVAQQADAEKVGLLGYSLAQTALCGEGVTASIDAYADETGAEVVYRDTSLPLGVSDVSAQVSDMRDEGVDFVVTCMDNNGAITVARELRRQGLDARMYLPNGYDHRVVEEYGDLLEGSIVRTEYASFEVDPEPPGLEDYLRFMEARGAEPSENSMIGWLNADLFVTGLREAGPDFSRQSVIDAINGLTDYTADGLLPGVDWTVSHTVAQPCAFFSRIEDGGFVPAFDTTELPFVCPGVRDGELVNLPRAEVEGPSQ
jgi:branched-chain amino acid transport system substrate-binding protein